MTKREMFYQVCIVIESTFFRIRRKMVPVALATGLITSEMYPIRGMIVATALLDSLSPNTKRTVPMIAKIVAKNSLQLTGGSSGRKQNAKIITKKGVV